MATVLITGANRGIGLELARQFAARGDRVTAAVRQSSPALANLGVRVEAGIDVASADGPRQLAERLSGATVDILINNAGVLSNESLEDLDLDRIRAQFEINALGPLRVTQALLPLLTAGSKVAIVTSRMGSIADNTSGGMYGYRMSKAAVNMAGVSLAKDLAARNVAVVILHPGFVRTEMTGGAGHVEPAEAAAGLVARIDALDLAGSGRFFHANGERLDW